MSTKRLVSGLLSTKLQAEVVIGLLENAGFAARDIALLEPLASHDDDAYELGTLRSLVDLGMVAVPELGVFSAHGERAPALAERAGVLVASCARGLLEGHFLISVEVRTGDESVRARKVLGFGGARQIVANAEPLLAA